MKKLSKKKITYIKFLSTFFALFIIIMWFIANTIDNYQTGYSSDVIVNVGSYPILKKSSEKDALEEESTIVSLTNPTDKLVSYKLYFTIDKISTIDNKYIRLNFDNRTFDLSTMNYLEINNKYYYFINEGTIDPISEEPFDSYVWIDNSFDGDLNVSKIYVDFDTLA